MALDLLLSFFPGALPIGFLGFACCVSRMRSFYMAKIPQQTTWKAWKQRLTALRNIPPVLAIVWASGPQVISANLACRIVAALIPLTMLWISRRIIDSLVTLFTGHGALIDGFWWLVALEFALATMGGMLGRAIGFFDTLFADRFTHHLSIRIMRHAASLDLAAYEDPVFYDKLERARVQATDRIALIQTTGTLVQQVILAASYSAAILLYSPWLLLILSACLIPALLGESHYAVLGYSLHYEQTPVRRQMDYLRVLGASKSSAKELKLFGLSAFLADRYANLSQQIYSQNAALAGRRLWAGCLLSLWSTLGYYGAYAWVIYLTVAGVLSVGKMTFLAGAIAGASTTIQSIFGSVSSIADQSLFLTDLLEFFAVRPKVRNVELPLSAPRPIRHGFEFRNVTFGYPDASRLVLDRLHFRLEPGERVALIGENGQGKTTLVKLMTRLYDPIGGQILLDGIDLREYCIEDLCREIGVIFQDFMRYEMTAAENIAMGAAEARHDMYQIHHAARQSLADDLIQKLPHKYQQMLGRRFEAGVDLSGGEWQKIALARAYLRDAQLLVLDEPTASLDSRSEHEVFQRFTDLTRGKMALLISHRFSTVRMADRIVVLENGTISEEGTHNRLMAIGGRYAEMFELQASSYR